MDGYPGAASMALVALEDGAAGEVRLQWPRVNPPLICRQGIGIRG